MSARSVQSESGADALGDQVAWDALGRVILLALSFLPSKKFPSAHIYSRLKSILGMYGIQADGL